MFGGCFFYKAPCAPPHGLISDKPMWEGGGEVSPISSANNLVPPKGVRELQACKESTGRLALSLQACSSLTPGHGTSPFVREVGQTSSTFPHRFVGDQTRRSGVGSLAKKYPPDMAGS